MDLEYSICLRSHFLIVSLFSVDEAHAIINQPCHSERSEESLVRVIYTQHAGS